MSDLLIRQWVNQDRTVLVRQYDDGQMEVATRPEPAATWGPPVQVILESVTE